MKTLHKGFTLVELIVVIAIIGILAAILVPAMISYITDSKLTSANATCKTCFVAVNSYAQKCIVAEKAIVPDGEDTTTNYFISPQRIITDDITPIWEWDASNHTLSVQDALNDCVYKYAGEETVGSKMVVQFDASGFPCCAIWSANSDDISGSVSSPTIRAKGYIGGYPKQADTTGWTLAKAKG